MRHLSFGYGIHLCLGAQLARKETRIALRRLLDRAPGLEVAGDLHWKPHATLRAMQEFPNADKVDKLFDGTTPGQDMLGALPDSLRRLLTPRGLALLRNPSGAFAQALTVADATCTGWAPRVPLRLYYAPGDEQAVTANTVRCRAAFRASGADPAPIDLGPHDYARSRHLGTAVSGTEAVVRWFTHLPG